MIFFDTETCGLHGPIVLLQYAEDDGPVRLCSVWKEDVQDVLVLLEKLVESEVVGFNLAFDWFHVCQLYTTFLHLDPNLPAEDQVEEYVEAEPLARFGPCLKPRSACDIMLHARKGPYQSTMDRSDIRIKRIPTPLAYKLAAELERRVQLKDIYFARRKQKNLPKWQVQDIEDCTDFKNIVLKFRASSALKALAVDALNLPQDVVLLFSDVEVERRFWPFELGYAPFAKAAIAELRRARIAHDMRVLAKQRRGPWPEVIKVHVSHWTYNDMAREYATKDVVYTRDLYRHFGSPEPGDDDSVLACEVGANRWRGYRINEDKIRSLRETAIRKRARTPTAPKKAREYIQAVMDETLKLGMENSTAKVVLEEISRIESDCERCGGSGELDRGRATDAHNVEFNKPIAYVSGEEMLLTSDGSCEWKLKCPTCRGTGATRHPAALRAEEVLEARKASKEVELYDKLLTAGRFHASFVVIGTLSSRMAGSDKLNAQGIKKTKVVRSSFPLSDDGYQLVGGDFISFEVVLADANYNDQELRKELLSGKSIHGIFGVDLFPGNTYEDIMRSKGTSRDLYTLSKSGVFAKIYGGEAYTLHTKLGVPMEVAEEASRRFEARFPGVRRARMLVYEKFCSMRQPGGIGTRVEWHEPAEKIESMLGFPRYFTLENMICKALFDLANKPPREWQAIKIKVVRRDREQTASGAVQSALYAAAFAMQQSNMRAAANHVIQSTGAQITKRCQRRIWDLQPPGVHPWSVQPMNIHDEIMCPTRPDLIKTIENTVKETVASFRPTVPLLEIDWSSEMVTWADK